MQEITEPNNTGSFRLGYDDGSLYGLFGPAPEGWRIGLIQPATGRTIVSHSRRKKVAARLMELAEYLYGLKTHYKPKTYAGLIECLQLTAIEEGLIV